MLTDGRTDDGVIGILIAHLGAFGSGELKIKPWLWAVMRENLSSGVCEQQRGRPACYSLIEKHYIKMSLK